MSGTGRGVSRLALYFYCGASRSWGLPPNGTFCISAYDYSTSLRYIRGRQRIVRVFVQENGTRQGGEQTNCGNGEWTKNHHDRRSGGRERTVVGAMGSDAQLLPISLQMDIQTTVSWETEPKIQSQ